MNDALIFHNGFQLLDTCSFANYGVANINIGNDWPVKIGCGSGPLGQSTLNFFNGKLDDIAIYNRALTQEEITALYTGTPVNNNNGGNTTANAVPRGIPYQAVVRNANGQVAANTAATTKFTLHQNTTDGAVEYQETHALTTNAQGLVSAVIGQGTAVQGTFAGINWSNTTKFLQVEVDLGNGYVNLGTQQLMSVPFALYAPNGPAGSGGFTHWVGEIYGGGVVFHVYKDALGEEHGLVVYTSDLSSQSGWGAAGIDVPNSESRWSGANNTANIVGSIQDYTAAGVCANFNAGGFEDWYLPSVYELEILYRNKFEVNQTLSSLSNSSYLGDTQFPYYWSSTEVNSSDAFAYFFLYDGYAYADGATYPIASKTNQYNIRAIRKF